jgi:hypothetical protein
MFYDLQIAAEEQFIKQESENVWKNSAFEKFNRLCADYSGKAGEMALFKFLNRTKNQGLHDWYLEYDGDANINQKDGTYDFAITSKKRKKLGQKTARIGKQKNFQHDNLHDNECDAELFLDILPNYAFLTIISFENYTLKQKHPIFGIKPHLRKNTSNNFKMDLTENHLNKSIKSEITIKIDINTSDEDIIKFISKFID